MSSLTKGDPLSPVAQQTIFGWVLSGPISPNEILSPVYGHHCAIDHDLQEILTRFWTQEEVPSLTAPILNEEEAECERHFRSTHSRDVSGRYVVRLPLKTSRTKLGDSKTTALRCLKRLSHRLSADSLYRQRYMEFIREYEALGHMIPVSISDNLTSSVNYLPHHGVLREQSSTTKLRVVFNGSSRTDSGISLNDILHAGAKLQTDISDVLLWTRTYRYLFSTDIVKMFRQVAIHHDDWDLQRILWLGQDQEPIAYHLTTVTYGLTCAPFLALRAIKQLIEDEGQQFPKAVPPLTKGRYVDDIFGGADSISEMKEIILQLTQLCSKGCFPLQKWNSNIPEVFPHIQSGFEEDTPTVEIEPNLHKMLGLVWRPSTDTFHFSAQTTSTIKFTKRIILSDIARLFDPLGLISPVLIRAKIILQELWILKTSWDEPLSPEMQQRWESFRQELQDLEQLSIPRWLGLVRSNNSVEIHGFSDASQLAMAAAVYLRVKVESEEYSVRLVCAKTKVAPLKRLSIPRLELTAALSLTRLVAHTQKSLELSEAPVFLWTDSSVTLAWINSHPSRWKDFVRNRVSAIQELLPSSTWHFVSGRENPADCASRGLRPEQLQRHHLWWKGPSWLSGPNNLWPSGPNPSTSETDLEERPGQVMITIEH